MAARWHPKARLWVEGRQNLSSKWATYFPIEHPVVWVHCASLGEFEQARPMMAQLKREYPQVYILLTFFSPSGYEIRKHYQGVDLVRYLPLDTPGTMQWLVELVRPSLVLLVKYELWLNWLQALELQAVPVIMVSARLTEQSGFRQSPLASEYAKILKQMNHIFAQDEGSLALFRTWIGPDRISLGGDTRYDRALGRVQQWSPQPDIEAFIGDRFCWVCGSTWPADEQILFDLIAQSDPEQVCFIIAPHEINPAHIHKWQAAFTQQTVIFSQNQTPVPSDGHIFWIDTIGMLGDLYAYADVAYVGGAFGKGLHNILEPAVYGCPLVFGPKHTRFPEASLFLQEKGAFVVHSGPELLLLAEKLTADDQLRSEIRRRNKDLVSAHVGASRRILQFIQEHALLPSVES